MESQQGSEKERGIEMKLRAVEPVHQHVVARMRQHNLVWTKAMLSCLTFFIVATSPEHQWKGRIKIPLKVLVQRAQIMKADGRNKSGMSEELFFYNRSFYFIFYLASIAHCLKMLYRAQGNTKATVGKEKNAH